MLLLCSPAPQSHGSQEASSGGERRQETRALHNHRLLRPLKVLRPIEHAPANKSDPADPEANESEESHDLDGARAPELTTEPLPSEVKDQQRRAADHTEGKYAETQILLLHHELGR